MSFRAAWRKLCGPRHTRGRGWGLCGPRPHAGPHAAGLCAARGHPRGRMRGGLAKTEILNPKREILNPKREILNPKREILNPKT